MADRITVSLDEETRAAFDRLGEETAANQSELVRRAIQFYEANLSVAEGDDADTLWRYSKALSGQDHVLLDRDFLHLFLRSVPAAEEAFQDEVKRVAEYHVPEYDEEFDSVQELLEWLAFCGFLEFKRVGNERVQLIFHDEAVRDVMGTFVVAVLEGLGYDVEVARTGITKVVLVLPALADRE